MLQSLLLIYGDITIKDLHFIMNAAGCAAVVSTGSDIKFSWLLLLSGPMRDSSRSIPTHNRCLLVSLSAGPLGFAREAENPDICRSKNLILFQYRNKVFVVEMRTLFVFKEKFS